MGVGAVGTTQAGSVYDVYEKKEEEKKAQASGKQESAKTDAAKEQGAVYEKSGEPEKKATYTANKMSEGDRATLVKQLKADQESRKQSLINIVNSMMSKQASAYAKAGGDDSMWKFLASGDYTVDAATKAKAQKDISEDGYWGVKQTSQRLFDFASALAGDDVNKMKEMQAAIEKGFKKATKSWGKELPGICHETMAATNKLFDDYYNSKSGATK